MTTPAYTTTTRDTTTTTTTGAATRTTGLFGALGPAMHAVLRIGTGMLFMQHGAQKLFGVLGGFGGTPGATAPLASMMGLAGVLEFFGGLLIVIGLFTRPVAFVLAGQMAAAYFMAHFAQNFFPLLNGGEPALLFMLVFLFLMANGAGPASADDAIASRRRTTTR